MLGTKPLLLATIDFHCMDKNIIFYASQKESLTGLKHEGE